ncbi:phosphotransferase family protein [Pseudactinotalea sp.]|uniref:phosphotransferase family protein n=1 Tax=Pseudactinotalea sp. TaxID=1926260 RepID=UPI003B3BA188
MISVVDWVRQQFPEVSWDGAEATHGAFHDVVVGRQVVARVGIDDACLRAEHATWGSWRSVELPVAVPPLLSSVRSDDDRSGYLVARLPGSPAERAPWATVRETFADLLAALRSVEVRTLALPPVRTWCGGARFPEIVREELAPLLAAHADDRVAALAVDAVDRMIALGSDGSPVLVHGDLGPHNLLWEDAGRDGGRATGLIDLDHAAITDQVVDLAPLVGFYGARAVREIAPADEVERAVSYRATLPLQVAAAAHLRGAISLRDHALGNAIRRITATT